MAEGVAACAVHSERASVSTCSRCGRFTCAACAESSPCLECQLRQREASPALSPVFDRLLGGSAVAYACCTLAVIPAMAQLETQGLKPEDFLSAPMLLTMAIEGVYVISWLALIAVWLAWFIVLHDWAAARGVDVPSKLGAVGGVLVCGVNLVHPLLTLLKVRRATGVKTPLELWWGLTWLSLALATGRSAMLPNTGYDPIVIVASLMEVVAVLLCWKVARDFRLADQAWDPRAQLAARG